jgi:hypothetical protein
MSSLLHSLLAKARRFSRENAANVAMMFGLSLVPMLIATGAGIDFARGVMVHQNMLEALDAAALAVGNATSKPASCSSAASAGSASNASCAALQQTAQQYFDQNYDHSQDANYGAPGSVVINISGQGVTLTSSLPLKLTMLGISAIGIGSPTINASSTVVWGQAKIWVSLVLDNTGSMTQTDSTGTSKISALQTASHQLLTIFQNASISVGDVQVSVVPFAKLVKIGTSYLNSAAIDWTDWQAAPRDYNGNADPPTPNTKGPGDSCPYSTNSDGFVCVASPGSSTNASTIPSSGTYKGYICPGVMQTYNASSGLGGHYFNGCYTSAATGTTQVSSGSSATCNGYTNCTCTGSGNSKKCNASTYTYTWVSNSHSTWAGCIEDRAQNFDTNNSSPSSSNSSLFPAANDDNCPVATILPLPATWTTSQWTTLGTEIDSMVANGSTNQTIGLAHGWQTLTSGLPYSAGSLPANTSEFIILVSDGLNTQDRWYGDGSNQATSVDSRMNLACTNAKAAGIVVYTIFVDLGGTQGNSTVLQNCATDSSKYFDLTTSGAIITTFNSIAQQITNLRVSQ